MQRRNDDDKASGSLELFEQQENMSEIARARGYSGAILATEGLLSRVNQSHHRAMQPSLQMELATLKHSSENFIIADTLAAQDMARENNITKIPVYPELHPTADMLGGLHSALSFAFQDWVAVVSMASPICNQLSVKYWDDLFTARANAPIIAMRHAKGNLEPTAAFYHRSLLVQINTIIKETSLATIHSLFDMCDVTVVSSGNISVEMSCEDDPVSLF